MGTCARDLRGKWNRKDRERAICGLRGVGKCVGNAVDLVGRRSEDGSDDNDRFVMKRNAPMANGFALEASEAMIVESIIVRCTVHSIATYISRRIIFMCIDIFVPWSIEPI